MRSRASRTPQLIPKATWIRKPEELRRRRCLDFLKLVRCDCENVALFRESRGLSLIKLRGKAIEAVGIVINLRTTADFSNSFVVFALKIADVTQGIPCEWVNFLPVVRFCGVVAVDPTSVGNDRRSFHLDYINAVLGCGICRFGDAWLRREEGHGRPRGEKCAR